VDGNICQFLILTASAARRRCVCVWEAKKRTERRFPPRCGVSSARLMRLDKKGIVRLALVVVVQPAARRLSRARVSEKVFRLNTSEPASFGSRLEPSELNFIGASDSSLSFPVHRRHHLHRRRALASLFSSASAFSSCCCCSISFFLLLLRYPSLWAFYFLPAAFDKNLSSSSSSLFSSSLEAAAAAAALVVALHHRR
jgi:hypothetical protein